MHDQHLRQPDSRSKDAHAPSPAEQAVEFLTALKPGPWQLFAHEPDGEHGFPCTLVTTEEGIARFVAEHDGKANLYYLLNAPRNPRLRKKPAKSDMGHAIGLHVDIDRSEGETAEAAKARAWAALNRFPFRAHFVVDSGNCLQAIWMFVTPVDLTDPVRVDSVNKALARRLDEGREGGEWNHDRVLRVPGTKNLPNAKKRGDGFVPCRGRLEWCRPDLPGYALEDFEAELAPELAKIAAGSKDRQAGQERTAESGDADPAAVEALWRKLPAELRRRIAVGIQPDKSRDCIAIIRALATDYEATADEIVAIFRAHPDGPAAHYRTEAEMRADIARVLSKPDARRQAKTERRYQTSIVWGDDPEAAPVPYRWTWKKRLALGKVSILAGDPKLGKSQIASAIEARITTEADWPDGEGRAPLGTVVVLAGEDAINDTHTPRLIANGGDLSRCVFVRGTVTAEDNSEKRLFDLRRDLDRLADNFATIRAKRGDIELLRIDPISAYMGDGDAHKISAVRTVISLLAEFAETQDVAVLAIHHPPKDAPAKAIHAFSGSIAFVAGPRFVMCVMQHPETQRRYLLHVGANIGSGSVPPLAYRFEEVHWREPTGYIETSRVEFDIAPPDVTADALMGKKPKSSRTQPVADRATEWVEQHLAAKGKTTTHELVEAGKAEGLSEHAIEKACTWLRTMRVIEGSRDVFGGPFTWWLVQPPSGAFD